MMVSNDLSLTTSIVMAQMIDGDSLDNADAATQEPPGSRSAGKKTENESE